MISKYYHRSVLVDALVYTGENLQECTAFVDIIKVYPDGEFSFQTNYGPGICHAGNYLVKGDGECVMPAFRKESFHKNYEPVYEAITTTDVHKALLIVGVSVVEDVIETWGSGTRKHVILWSMMTMKAMMKKQPLPEVPGVIASIVRVEDMELITSKAGSP